MSESFIVDAVRTPVGKRGGGLAAVHSADLGAAAVEALVARVGVDPALIDDVVFGCCDTIGSQSGNIARTVALVAGLPEHVPGVTVDRQCGSSQQALQFAAQAVASGAQQVVVAGGVQNMSAIPISSAMTLGAQFGFSTPTAESVGWAARYGDQEISQFRAADMIAEHWDLSREEMELFALESHRRAVAAQEAGAFDAEIVPVAGISRDEGPRPDTSLERMAGLAPLREGGRVTAALSSQISDAAAAVLVASDVAVDRYGLTPRARIVHASARGADPVWMLTAPIDATRVALERAGLTVDDIDLFEVNEAFASIPMAWAKELGVDHDRLNVLGGAMALGHPIGATGARIMTTMLGELERRGGRYALQAVCEGGGTANVTIIERV